jgi:ferrous iron transport protein B
MSCHDTPATPVATLERTATVALVGNPNVGKSTLFNALTGARQKVTNAPGTTVELQVGTWRGLRTRARAEQSRQRVRLLDLPGTYSLLARSPDERVTADAVAGRGSLDAPDLAVVLVEAAALSRSLYLLAQVAQSGQRVVVALTMTDVAAARGIEVDAATLADVLGVPVAAIDPAWTGSAPPWSTRWPRAPARSGGSTRCPPPRCWPRTPRPTSTAPPRSSTGSRPRSPPSPRLTPHPPPRRCARSPTGWTGCCWTRGSESRCSSR